MGFHQCTEQLAFPTHTPEVFHEDAYRESRKEELRTKWIFIIDLFATRLNTHLPEFISYQTDPESKAVHVSAQSWTDLKFFYFLPFMCLPRVIQKI